MSSFLRRACARLPFARALFRGDSGEIINGLLLLGVEGNGAGLWNPPAACRNLAGRFAASENRGDADAVHCAHETHNGVLRRGVHRFVHQCPAFLERFHLARTDPGVPCNQRVALSAEVYARGSWFSGSFSTAR